MDFYMEPIIKTENLTHAYSVGTAFERVAIKDINFEAYKGEYIAMIGHTGSGKSTLVGHLNGLNEPTSGRVLYCGEDIHKSKEFLRSIRFKVGMVFQYPEYQLFEETVEKDVAFGPKNMGLGEDEIARRVEKSLEMVGIPRELFKASPFELSGGQKRMTAIAGVMAMEPEVLILDEPTAGLDPRGRDEILDYIDNYRRETGATIIMVTHDMSAAAERADRLCVMHRGSLVIDDTPENVFSDPERMTQLGLDIPDVTKIAMRLKELGVDLGGGIYTVKKAKDAILRLKGGRGGA